MVSNRSHENPMLRPEAASAFTGLAVSTLAKLRMSGKGPEYIKLGKVVVYDPGDLDEWLNRNRRKSTTCTAEVQ